MPHKNYAKLRWGMPYYGSYEWDNNKMWILPSGWRRHPITKKLPYPVGEVGFTIHFETQSNKEQKVIYYWIIKKKANGGEVEIGVSGNGEVIIPPKGGISQKLDNPPLAFPEQYWLTASPAVNKPRKLIVSFEIPPVDKSLRQNLERLGFGAIGVGLTLLIQKLAGAI
ncbi:hypothetical protein ACFLTJ_01700 [Chloroflexota bacterium]